MEFGRDMQSGFVGVENIEGLMDFGCGMLNGFDGVENFDDGFDVKMSETEEGELVEMISKTELGENSGVISNTELQEKRVGTENVVDKDSGGKNQKHAKNKRRKNKKKKKNKGNKDTSGPNIPDINRFVTYTCRRLKEKKSYLVWTAVACLGVSALSDLVNEVEAIQACGGQKTNDGRRFRNGGGILWKVIKERQPNAYVEIMKKGREFEKQLKQVPLNTTNQQPKQATSQKTPGTADRISSIPSVDLNQSPMLHDSHEQSTGELPRQPVHNRIRVPITYDDLYEE